MYVILMLIHSLSVGQHLNNVLGLFWVNQHRHRNIMCLLSTHSHTNASPRTFYLKAGKKTHVIKSRSALGGGGGITKITHVCCVASLKNMLTVAYFIAQLLAFLQHLFSKFHLDCSENLSFRRSPISEC